MTSVSNLPSPAGRMAAPSGAVSASPQPAASPPGGLAAMFAKVLAALQVSAANPAEARAHDLDAAPAEADSPSDAAEHAGSESAAPDLLSAEIGGAESAAAAAQALPEASAEALEATLPGAAPARGAGDVTTKPGLQEFQDGLPRSNPAPLQMTSLTTGARLRQTLDLVAPPAVAATAGTAPVPATGLDSALKDLLTTAMSKPGAGPQQSLISVDARGDAFAAAIKPASAEWAPIKVDTRHGQWSHELAAALGERLTMQVQQNVKEATVRLDPPELGRIELVVRMDGDRLSVQLNASHAGVRDLLSQHAERLRHELLEQNLQLVDVQVGQQGRDGSSDRHHAQTEVIAGNIAGSEPESRAGAQESADRWLSTSA